MRTYGHRDLEAAFRNVGLAEGHTVLVHSSLMTLGGLDGCAPAELPSRICDVLRAVVGQSGTIVVPTFNFDFCKGVAFDPATTPSKGMGAFSEFVRTLPRARRSPHAMQSVAAVGPQAEAICTPDTASSFDPGGPFSAMVEFGARGLLLGAPMQSFSLVHMVEERLEVPYRYWKTFTAPYGFPPTPRDYRMYVRDLALNPKLVLSRIEDVLAERSLLVSARVGSGWIKSFVAADFLAVAMEHLERNPRWLLSERPGQQVGGSV